MFNFLEEQPLHIPLVILDTETTGLRPALGDRVVEIGAMRLENGQVTAEFSHLLNPGRPMNPRASAVNGIHDADLQDQPRFAQVADQLLELLQGALLIAHNAQFDAAFLGQEYFVTGHATDPRQGVPANPWLCTLTLARNYFTFAGNSLGRIAQQMGVRFGQTHRAMQDVYLTTEIFKRMLPQLRDRNRLYTVGDLLHAQGGPILTPPPPDVFLPQPLATALRLGQQLEILYVSPQFGESRRIITPLYSTESHGTSYLVAHCHLRQAQRTFRLDRIFDAQLV